jgi:hypothetical protein
MQLESLCNSSSIGKLLGNAQYPLSPNSRGGRIAQRLLAKTRKSPFLSPGTATIQYIFYKLGTHLKILKSLSGWSSNNFLLDHTTTFSQTETSTTVPLKMFYAFSKYENGNMGKK